MLNVPGENHHVIPRSLGGSDVPSNIVRLTSRAHYVCHLLLIRMHTGPSKRKMLYAFNLMSSLSRYATSKKYAKIRSEISQQLSDTAKKRNASYWNDPFHRKHASDVQKIVNAKLDVKKRKSDSQKRAWQSLEIRQKQAQISKVVASRSDVVLRHANALMISNAKPEVKLNRSEGQKRRWAARQKELNVNKTS